MKWTAIVLAAGIACAATAATEYALDPKMEQTALSGFFSPVGGHVQGACSDGQCLFLTQQNCIFKVDRTGHCIKRVDTPRHTGDICFYNGLIYTSDVDSQGNHKGQGVIRVYDTDLSLKNERYFPGHGLDGIVALDGVLYVGGGRSPAPKGAKKSGSGEPHRENRLLKVNPETLETISEHMLDHGAETKFGIQNATTDGTYLYFTFYAADKSAPNLAVYDKELKLVDTGRMGTGEGLFFIGGKDGVCRFVCGRTTASKKAAAHARVSYALKVVEYKAKPPPEAEVKPSCKPTSERVANLYLSHVHRGGGAKERPDNTLETFKWCWENGSALECDCRKTKDGVGIMLHDDRLKRTARGISDEMAQKSVSKGLTWDEIKDVDVGSYLDPSFAHHRIPTIEATFAAMKGHPTYLCFVDEKGAGPDYIAQKAKEAGVADQVYYTGSRYANVARWNQVLPGGKSLLWIGAFPKDRSQAERERVRAHFERVVALVRDAEFANVTAVSLHTYYDPNDPVDPFLLGTEYLRSLIQEFHANGVKVCSIPFAGGDKKEVYYKLWELGCDAFSTDYPSVMFEVIKDLKNRAE